MKVDRLIFSEEKLIQNLELITNLKQLIAEFHLLLALESERKH